MPTTTLDTSDAAELADMLTFIADWLSSSQKQTLAASLATFVGHTAYHVETLRADLHRFTFLLGGDDGKPLFGPGPD